MGRIGRIVGKKQKWEGKKRGIRRRRSRREGRGDIKIDNKNLWVQKKFNYKTKVMFNFKRKVQRNWCARNRELNGVIENGAINKEKQISQNIVM